MKQSDVVITGMGLVSPIGLSVGENWENVKALKTGIRYYPDDAKPAFLKYMGKIEDFHLPTDVPQKLFGQMKFLNRGAQLGFGAAHQAAAAAGLAGLETPAGRRALYIASGDFTKVGYDFLYPAIKDASAGTGQIDAAKLNDSTLSKVNPFFLLESLSNNLFSFLSAYLEFMGPNTSLASLSPCGGYAIELASRSIRHGKADVAVAVGCGNWITEIPLFEIEELGIISRAKDGINSFRPFDRRRDGFIAGEGGAALVLESAAHAEKRGAKVLGRIRGTANCIEFTEKPGFSVPPMVSRRSIEIALEDAGSSLSDLAFITPHGSGTQKGDASELRSVAALFKETGTSVPLSGLKPYTGHLGAGSDIAEVILGIRAVQEEIVPGTLNFTATDSAFSGLEISSGHKSSAKKQFLSTSYGVGGQSSTVVVEIL